MEKSTFSVCIVVTPNSTALQKNIQTKIIILQYLQENSKLKLANVLFKF